MKFHKERDLKIVNRLLDSFLCDANYIRKNENYNLYKDHVLKLEAMGAKTDRNIAIAIIAIASLESKEPEVLEMFKMAMSGDYRIKYIADKFNCTTSKVNYHRDKFWKMLKIRYNKVYTGIDNAFGTYEEWIYNAGIRAGISVNLKKRPINDMNTGLDQLGLSALSFNCLRRVGINTVGDLVSYVNSGKDLRMIRNVGNRSAEEILNKLKDIGV